VTVVDFGFREGFLKKLLRLKLLDKPRLKVRLSIEEVQNTEYTHLKFR
jgi:hypothetical protein